MLQTNVCKTYGSYSIDLSGVLGNSDVIPDQSAIGFGVVGASPIRSNHNSTAIQLRSKENARLKALRGDARIDTYAMGKCLLPPLRVTNHDFVALIHVDGPKILRTFSRDCPVVKLPELTSP